METSKKRKRLDVQDSPLSALNFQRNKRRRHKPPDGIASNSSINPVLAHHFPIVLTLRQHVLASLPASSKVRRRKIRDFGNPSDKPRPETEAHLVHLLDNCLVGLDNEAAPLPETDADGRQEKWKAFIQGSRGDNSRVPFADSTRSCISTQSEVVDFVVWLLFSRASNSNRPHHLLCDGFRKGVGRNIGNQSAAPGLHVVFPNNNVRILKDQPWPQLLTLLGSSGQRLMVNLLLDCSVFVPLNAGYGNFLQVTGIPLHELRSEHRRAKDVSQRNDSVAKSSTGTRSPSEITFVRSRILYARPALNPRGGVRFGLRHIHVLNRCPYIKANASGFQVEQYHQKNEENTLKVMMYIFPRQFGLHNVFTSQVDFKQTAQKFQDYTMRDREIFQKYGGSTRGPRLLQAKIPKRLRGAAKDLVEKLQKLHGRCAYYSLFQHYCPVPGVISQPLNGTLDEASITKSPAGSARASCRKRDNDGVQEPKAHQPQMCLEGLSIPRLATSAEKVSAFCQAVVSSVIPNRFWGTGDARNHNKRLFLKQVDRFVRLRQFESLSLHEVIQGVKISELEWLVSPNLAGRKACMSETQKKAEILHEFVYYIFDSFIIPLIRSNFYVTESNVHRHKIFFFRHDVWKCIAEPVMKMLKVAMFEEVNPKRAAEILASRRLGYSQIRLLPKSNDMRPILNLRKRVADVIKHEMLGDFKGQHPGQLGSSMFSVGDMYNRIKAFKSKILPGERLFFAKVDVKSAFDTVPQNAVVRLMKRVLQHSQYTLAKYVELGPSAAASGTPAQAKPLRRWHSRAMTSESKCSIFEALESQIAKNKSNAVFVDTAAQKLCSVQDLLRLLSEHIHRNLVKIGKKYYRQKNGIPQGSVLSSALCNYFYADLERKCLGFVNPETSLLLRLIDDFLVITTDRKIAAEFVSTMHVGVDEYGISVNPKKSLVNFELKVNGVGVSRVDRGSNWFPYVGTMINMTTLNLTKDIINHKDANMSNTLTVEYSRAPGQSFQRKVLKSFQIQSHAMFYDTSLNSQHTVLSNIYAAFVESANKMWAYARCLPRHRQPGAELVMKTIVRLGDMAFTILTSTARKKKSPDYVCQITRTQVAWLAAHAFREILGRKQTRYRALVKWLDEWKRKMEGKRKLGGTGIRKIIGGMR